MDPHLTNEDVADILALLDSLPYDALDLETPRFRLTLRRTPGGWTQITHITGPPGGWVDGTSVRSSRTNGTSTQPDSGGDGADVVEGAGGIGEAGADEDGDGDGTGTGTRGWWRCGRRCRGRSTGRRGRGRRRSWRWAAGSMRTP